MPSRLIFWLLLLLVGCTAVPTPSPTPIIPLNPLPAEQMTASFPSPAYAIHVAQWWDLHALERDLGLVQEMGFGWVKQKFAWRDIEPSVKGEYDWYRPDYIVDAAERHGLQLIVRLDRQPFWTVESLPDEQIQDNQPPVDLADFGDFCGEMANRYQGRIAAYQVWNEPNLDREWGMRQPNPAEYTALLKVCYEAIKAADPSAIVISAGLAPTGGPLPHAMPDDAFLQGMYDAGASAYFDVLGLNAPGYKAPPEVAPEEAAVEENGYGNGRWFVFRHVEDMRRIMVQNGDAAKQVAILEMGWTTDPRPDTGYSWHAVSEAEQADYLVRAYGWAQAEWRPWIGPMTTIFFADTNWTADDEQYWWSIVLPDGSTRPAYEALKGMPKE